MRNLVITDCTSKGQAHPLIRRRGHCGGRKGTALLVLDNVTWQPNYRRQRAHYRRSSVGPGPGLNGHGQEISRPLRSPNFGLFRLGNPGPPLLTAKNKRKCYVLKFRRCVDYLFTLLGCYVAYVVFDVSAQPTGLLLRMEPTGCLDSSIITTSMRFTQLFFLKHFSF
jgi:hypothetical protein